jgi:hypothetical protein
MPIAYLSSDQLDKLNRELDLECAELARQNGHVTASQRNRIAALLISEALNSSVAGEMSNLCREANKLY